jgi:type IX secretion system PorP/SprF family membrane protein
MKRFLLSVVSLVFCASAFGQDVHFSQFYAAPLNLNPSQTGLINGNLRGIINYRNQWNSFAPYTTYNGSLDVNLGQGFLDRDLIGIGVNFYNDVAGDADFSTTHASLSVSYIKTLGNRFARNYLSVGFSGGLVQRSVDYSKMTFGSQFNGYEYDPSLFTGELVAFENLSYLDLAGGITWLLVPKDQLNFYMGLAFHHLNQPDQSFTGLSSDNLYLKTTGHMGAQIPLNQSTFLVPNVLAMIQGPHYQLNGGMSVKYIINDLDYKSTAVSIGAYQRVGVNEDTDYRSDATIIAARFDYLNLSFGLSYDVNVSTLQDASNALGGPEVSLTFTSDLPHRDRRVDCPKF